MREQLDNVLAEVKTERERQDAKFSEQNHHPLEWVAILGEEFGEVSKAAVEAHFTGYASSNNWANYREELIQVAAVAVAMVEALDRKEASNE
ncbi:MazG-like family protein [Rufibacter soli]